MDLCAAKLLKDEYAAKIPQNGYMLYTITQKGYVVHNDFLNQTDTWLWDQ